jgi:hypothetical protein
VRRAEISPEVLETTFAAVLADATKTLFLTSHAANQSSSLPSLSLAECLNFLPILLSLTSSAPKSDAKWASRTSRRQRAAWAAS